MPQGNASWTCELQLKPLTSLLCPYTCLSSQHTPPLEQPATHKGSYWEVVEQVSEHLPHVGVAIPETRENPVKRMHTSTKMLRSSY